MTLKEIILSLILGILLAHLGIIRRKVNDWLIDADLWILRRVKDYHDWQDHKRLEEYRKRMI